MSLQDQPLAYVMTHYPRVALSFISGEIDEIEALGGTIHPIAMNLPDQTDLLSEDAKARQARTHYLKRGWIGLLGLAGLLGLRRREHTHVHRTDMNDPTRRP